MAALSIKAKLAIGMTVASLVGIFAFTTVALRVARDDLREVLSAEQTALVRHVAADLDSDLRFAVTSLRQTSLAVEPDERGDPAALAKLFAHQPALLSVFDDLFVVTGEGLIVADYPRLEGRSGRNVADRPYFQKLLKTSATVISSPVAGGFRKEPVVNVAVPVFRADGSLGAVVIGSVRLGKSNFLGDLADAKIGQTGYFFILTKDREPIYVMHPDRTRILKHRPFGASDAATRALEGGDGTEETVNSRGVDVLETYRSLTAIDWVLVAALPSDEAFAPLARMQRRIITIAVIAASLLLPLIYLFAGLLLAPLSKLAAEIRTTGDSDEDLNTVPEGRDDEIGHLARAFNALVRERAALAEGRKAIERERAMLARTLEASGDFVAMTDVEGNLRYLNEAGRAVRGMAPDDDATATRLSDHYPPWVMQKLMTEAVPTAVKEGVWVGQTAVFDAHGQELPVEHMVIAHRDGDGKLEYFSGVMRDKAEARLAEQALRESEARLSEKSRILETTLERMDQGIMMVNSDRVVEVCNRRAVELLGLPAQMMADRPTFEEVLAYQWRTNEFVGIPPSLQDFIRSGGILSEAHTYDRVRPDGTVIEFRSVPLEGGGLVRTYTDITERKRAEDRIRFVAQHDGLTSLVNRNEFLERLGAAIDAARVSGQRFAVHYLDLDRFKPVNDRLGHAAGDKLLIYVAERMRRTSRDSDLVARMGGDEFAILQGKIGGAGDAFDLAARVLAQVRQSFEIEGEAVEIGISIGIALYPESGASADQLLKSADEALYEAKAGGRNTVRLCDKVSGVRSVEV